MEEQVAKEEVTSVMSKTKGGYDCIISNGLTIRKSESAKRLIEDDETFDEYRIRLKMLREVEKDKKSKPQYLHISRFNIKGQNYVSTYVKKEKLKN